MIEPTGARPILYLVTEGLSNERREELEQAARNSEKGDIEIFLMTETNSAQALRKIFTSDSVAVWGEL